MNEHPPSKTSLRSSALHAIRALDEERRATASAEVRGRLMTLVRDLGPGALLGFAPLSSEPDIGEFLETTRDGGRSVLLPRPGAEEGSLEAVPLIGPLAALRRDRMGVRIPSGGPAIPLSEIGLVLVPGLMFDPWGKRLGRGGGYYDRLLARLPRARCVGICFECCIGERVPVEDHDRCVDLVVTEDRTIDCTRDRRPEA